MGAMKLKPRLLPTGICGLGMGDGHMYKQINDTSGDPSWMAGSRL